MSQIDVPTISMLDEYLSDESDILPWFHSSYQLDEYSNESGILPWFRSSYQLDDRGMVLAKQRQMCEELSETLGYSYEISRAEICCSDNQFLLESQTATDDDHLSMGPYIISDNEPVNDDAAVIFLQDSLDIEVTLAMYQQIYDESAPQTLKKRFELAKIIERSGNHEEAQYHCRIILDIHPQIDVHIFLGMILVNESRIEDATFLLFSALTEFIIQFSFSSIKENDFLFALIEKLWIELVRRDDDYWSSLTSCLIKMINIVDEGISNDAIDLSPPQLYLCGFSFANECTVLGFIDSAMHIYRRLLESSPAQLDAARYGIEKAEAYQRYGLLLRQKNEWTSSAKQLLLAYKSIIHSGTHDYQLIAVLEIDYTEFMAHQTSHFHEESSLTNCLGEMFTHCRRECLPRVQENSAANQGLPIEDYLSSNDSPIPLSILEHSADFPVSQPGSHSRATEISPRSRDHTSTESMSASVCIKYGITFSGGSEGSMVSNSCLMVQ